MGLNEAHGTAIVMLMFLRVTKSDTETFFASEPDGDIWKGPKVEDCHDRYCVDKDEDESSVNLQSANYRDPTVCCCRHSESSEWTRSMYCVCFVSKYVEQGRQ